MEKVGFRQAKKKVSSKIIEESDYFVIIIYIMSSLNFLNLKNLAKGEQQLFRQTKQTMNSLFFQSVHEFQEMVKLNAKYLSFNPSKLPTVNQIVDSFDFRPIKELTIGINRNIQILIKILRVMQIKENLICLAADEWPGVENKYLSVCIMFASSQLASKWHLANGFLSELAAFVPYLNYQSKYKSSLVILKYDNIRVIKTIDLRYKKTSEEIKSIANNFFKKQQFIEALIGYELALGLLVDHQKIKERSVLYANSSQCFHKLRLYENSLIYADTAIVIDPTYIKSIYRKLNSLIQLNKTRQIPKLLTLAAKYGTEAELKEINHKYKKYMQNNIGIFNWQQIFTDGLLQFNEYINEKIALQRNEAKDPKYRFYYTTEREIKKFQLITVVKPLEFYMNRDKSVYKEAKNNQEQLIKKIYFLTILEERFRSIINRLPRRNFVKKASGQSKIKEMCHVNIITPKSLYPSGQVHGIWPQFYKFKHECESNCSYIVINGGLFIFATKKILPSETLTVDYVQTLFKQRYLQLNPKQISICFCSLCNYDWSNFNHSKNILSSYSGQKANSKNRNTKLLLIILWQIIIQLDSQYFESYSQVFQELMKELNSYPEWNIVYNLLRSSLKNNIFKHHKQELCQLFVSFFKVNIKNAINMLTMIIGQ